MSGEATEPSVAFDHWLLSKGCQLPESAVLSSATYRLTGYNLGSLLGHAWIPTAIHLLTHSASSFCIFVTTRLTSPLIALCTLEGLRVSVVPVQTSCPSGAPST